MEKLNKFTKFFRKIYYQVCIENFKDKLIYNFPQNYHRWDLIDYLIGYLIGYIFFNEIGIKIFEIFGAENANIFKEKLESEAGLFSGIIILFIAGFTKL